jgi:3',5'-cyclic AMP phosphodiesterase CpdA
MKRALIGSLAAVLALAAAALSLEARRPEAAPAGLVARAEGEANPWTHLRANVAADEFRFAVVTDRTGGPRAGVFERAVEGLNNLQPEFVLSVGDLVQGSTRPDTLTTQWKEFEGFTAKLQMPFFYVAGNHDAGNNASRKLWKEKFGRLYYHFQYKGVLFLVFDTELPGKSGGISEEQLTWAKGVLAENADARWTVVAMHKPLWTYADGEANGLGALDKLLTGRKYTVFAGHKHRYEKSVRHGMNYYMLATTGGSSALRGVPFGEFDQLVWVTMKSDGPRLANLMLEGVFGDDLNTTLRAKSGAGAADPAVKTK